ncbi:MAG: orotate phosphoribosyltransferase [Legionellales bacterium RIFCSPHIGHO2_12_FULL_35_11]|nr:MAG: orotate phosphoribosyltransferase [Legionellales bacterium RIFCSPHIGHO2_12_FULL_35_11]
MKQELIQLAIKSNVLRFGEFQLKSGRISPYFFNAGLFYTGEALRSLGRFYAKVLISSKINFQHLFGPAYKGLPLATATSIALQELGINSTVTFNRKEEKVHGEGGNLIGSPLSGKTVIIDDVITAGTAFRESKIFIEENGGELSGIVIALDRCERGSGDDSAINEIKSTGIEVISIISLFDIIEYLKINNEISLIDKLYSYHEMYGAKNFF